MFAGLFYARIGFSNRIGAVHATFKVSAVFLLTLAAAGCAGTPRAQVAAADPAVHAPATGYNATTRGYSSLRPVEPRSWREQNERVTPRPRQ